MRKLLLLLPLLCLPLLSGCAALGTFAAAVTPTASKVLDTAVAIGVTAELLKDPATTHLKAVAFSLIAQQVLADSSNPAVTVAQLEDTLNKRLIALAPNPVIAASVISVIGGIQGALNNIIGTSVSGPVTQGTLVAISGIAKQVIQVCAFY
jgi:hypothetical protein